MESVKPGKSPKGKHVKGEPTERLTLQSIEQAKLERWVQELNAKFDGMIRLTKSDLANFLIRHHQEKLTDSEVALIEAEHFDELRWINWALTKIREAKRMGESLTLEDLMTKRKVQPAPIKRTRRKLAPESADKEPTSTSSRDLDLMAAKQLPTGDEPSS